MLEYLSDAWLEALAATLASLPGAETANPPVELSAGPGQSPDVGDPPLGVAPEPAGPLPMLALGQVVTGVPRLTGGELHYTIVMGGPAGPRLEVGTIQSADVVLVTSYPDAAALFLGSSTAADLLALGRVKIRGDAGRVVQAAALVEQAARATALLRDRTVVVAVPQAT
ncbi:MAG: hypothetical protein ACRD0Z_05140 [Acidimicrobiales bacterium]